tara:strand:+ start:983 stop:1249 length:267 start_codon:yes stop_codon:yes gene_type:complete
MNIETILDMNFDQIQFAAKCVYKHKVDMINMVFEPIAAAFGGKKQPKSIKNKVSSPKKANTNKEKLAKEQHKLSQLSLLGIGVRDIMT